MSEIHIYDDGPMFGYRIRLFESIANNNKETLFILHANYFEIETNLPNVKLIESIEYKFGRFRFRGFEDYLNLAKKKCVISINWNYPLDLLMGLLTGSKFWGGGYTVRASKSYFLFVFIKLFSVLSSGVMLYSNKLLNIKNKKIYYFRNLSQFCFVDNIYPVSDAINNLPDKYVLFVGRIDSRKGLEKLLSISGSDINYVIVGSGSGLPRLVELVKKNELNVTFISGTADVDSLYEIFERCSLIVSPGQTGLLAEDATYFRKHLFTVINNFSGPEPAVAADDGYIHVFDNLNNLYDAMREQYLITRYQPIDTISHHEWINVQMLQVIGSWSKFLELKI